LPSDDVDGIQFSAKVVQVPNNEILEVLPKYFAQSFPNEELRKKWFRPLSNFEGLMEQRFYRIIPLDMYTIDLESVKVDKKNWGRSQLT